LCPRPPLITPFSQTQGPGSASEFPLGKGEIPIRGPFSPGIPGPLFAPWGFSGPQEKGPPSQRGLQPGGGNMETFSSVVPKFREIPFSWGTAQGFLLRKHPFPGVGPLGFLLGYKGNLEPPWETKVKGAIRPGPPFWGGLNPVFKLNGGKFWNPSRPFFGLREPLDPK